MMRPGPSTLAVCALVALAGCSGPEAPRDRPVPDENMPTPAPPPISVHVQVPEGADETTVAWADALRDAIAARQGDLTLTPPEDAQVVVRVDSVETGVEVDPPPPGEGEISVMRGALLVGVSTREFQYAYRGDPGIQAETLARNLRAQAVGGGNEPAEPASEGDQPSTEDAEEDAG